MAEYDVEIKVDPKDAVTGSKKAKQALKTVENQADSLRNSLNNALKLVGIGVGISGLINLIDTYTNLQNRIRVVTSSNKELVDSTKELYDIANRTRSNYQNTVELFSRVSLATRNLGIEQKQVTQFTESLNQAIILSGAGAQEAKAGLIQLSQGMASGTLRGEELRSVLEQLPVVADVIAKQMGTTRGGLRDLGAEGKIAAEDILEGFKNAREELEERFAETVPTLAQSFEVLRNSVIRAIGEMNNSIGASRNLSLAIIFLSEHMDTLIRVTIALATALGTYFVRQGINKAIAGLDALKLAITTNPLGVLIIALTAAIALLVLFNDKITFGAEGLVTLGDYGKAAFQLISEFAMPVVLLIKDQLTAAIESAGNYFGGLGITFSDVLKIAKTVVNSIIGYWVGMAKATSVVMVKIAELIQDIYANDITQTIVTTLKAILQFTVDTFNKTVDVISSTLDYIGLELQAFSKTVGVAFDLPELKPPKGLKDFGAEVSAAFLSGFDKDYVGEMVDIVAPAFEALTARAKKVSEDRISKEAQDLATKSRDKSSRALEEQDKKFEAIIKDLQNEATLLKLTNNEREIQQEIFKAEKSLKRDLTGIEDKRITAILKSNQALKAQVEIMDSINEPVNEYKDTLEALNVLEKQGAISRDQYNKALAETELATSLKTVKTEVSGPGTEDIIAITELQNTMEARLEIIRQAREAELLTQQEYNTLALDIQRQYNDDVEEIEKNRFQMQKEAVINAFSVMTEAAKDYAGEQSDIYQGLFAISKAFAIAETTVAIVQGIANAAKLGWPANIPAIAGTIAQTAGLISQIQSTDASGFQNGGSFKVGGAGGTDSQLVSFKASPDETVSIRTPGQERMSNEQSSKQTQEPILNVTSVNVMDPNLFEDYLNSPSSDRAFMNKITRNKTQVSGIIGGGRR